MWIKKLALELLEKELAGKASEIVTHVRALETAVTEVRCLREQKVKDDLTIDWMRHRVNALEKQNAVLLNKATGMNFPVAEIVPTRPGSMTVPDFAHLPSFEDVGDEEAERLKIAHDNAGNVVFDTKTA